MKSLSLSDGGAVLNLMSRRLSCPVQRAALESWCKLSAAQGTVTRSDIDPANFGRAMSVGAIVDVERDDLNAPGNFRHGYEGGQVEAFFGRSKGDLFRETYSELYLFAVEPFYMDAVTSRMPGFQPFSTESDQGALIMFSQLALPLSDDDGEIVALFVVYDFRRMMRPAREGTLSLHTAMRQLQTEDRRPSRLAEH